MSLVHRYIFTTTLAASFAAILIFAFILLISEGLRDLVGLVAEGQVSFRVLGTLVLVIFQHVFAPALPIGFLSERTFVKDLPGYVVFVGEKNGPELGDLRVWMLDDGKRADRSIRARSENFEDDWAANTARGRKAIVT